MKYLAQRLLCRCSDDKRIRVCLWCVGLWLSLPLEHGLWEWTRMETFLPLIGLHI